MREGVLFQEDMLNMFLDVFLLKCSFWQDRENSQNITAAQENMHYELYQQQSQEKRFILYFIDIKLDSQQWVRVGPLMIITGSNPRRVIHEQANYCTLVSLLGHSPHDYPGSTVKVSIL